MEKIRDIVSEQQILNNSKYEIENSVLTITTSDGYVFEVTEDEAGEVKISYIARTNEIPPIINITATSGTTVCARLIDSSGQYNSGDTAQVGMQQMYKKL